MIKDMSKTGYKIMPEVPLEQLSPKKAERKDRRTSSRIIA